MNTITEARRALYHCMGDRPSERKGSTMKILAVVILPLVLLFVLACAGGPTAPDAVDDIIRQSIRTLHESGVPDTNEAVLFLKRYQFYLSQLQSGKAYLDWRGDDNPPIYNATVFLRMMDQRLLRRIVTNARTDRDAFAGITGFFERAYISDVDQSLDSYIIYVPHTFSANRKYPLLVNLHGWGDSAHLNPFSPVHFDILKACEKRGVILVSPCGRQKLPGRPGRYVDDAERDVLQVISLVKKFYPVDESRVYLTGNSMGGFGAYWIASRHPELFAAIAPVCGIWSGILYYPRVDLDALKNTPVALFHNDLDGTVPVSESREAYAYLKKIGAEVTYQEFKIDGKDAWDVGIFGGHNAWDYAYQGTDLVDWFLKHKRN